MKAKIQYFQPLFVAAILCFWAGFAASATAAPPPAKIPDKIDFNRDIRPILSDNCYTCHGPDKNKRQANLRLDTKDGLFNKIDDINPVVPGNLDDSVLYMRITSDDPEYRMPEPKSGKTLAPHQIALIKKWIEQGAGWKGHWSYLAPAPVEAPKVSDPFIKNNIDCFILDKLKEQGLKPAPPADRVTLIRRLYFDLLGMPPTPEEVDEFVNDTSPEAYASLVNRLLASPHYGERMAVNWLDLVRYADTIGYHSDNPREVSPFRDYVINAFNYNKPFNQFTIEQLAGDLIPNATIEQKVASGYNRLIESTEEGGAQPKEYEVKNFVDRVRNVSSVWMGATMGCAQCHDHKFDPYKARDFYQMAAFFADIKEEPIGRRVPELMLPDEKQQQQIKDLNTTIATLNEKLEAPTPQLALEQAKWEQEYREKAPVEWTTLHPTVAESRGGATMTIAPNGVVTATGNNPAKDTYVITTRTRLKGATAFRLEVFPDAALVAKGPGRSGNGNFVLTGFEVSKALPATRPVADEKGFVSSHSAARAAMPATQPVDFNDASGSIEQALGAETFPQKKWTPLLAIDPKKTNPQSGWAILPELGKSNHAVFQTAADLGDGSEVQLSFALHFDFGDQHTIGKFRLSATSEPRPVKAQGADSMPPNIRNDLVIDSEERTTEQKEEVAKYFRSIAPSLDPVRTEIAARQKEKDELIKIVPKTMISIAAAPRVVRVLNRGNWQDETGEVVQPAVPHFLKQLDVKGRRPTRMDLAKWLVARDNPLTARVFMNRLWKMYFGQGLAQPLDDLGSQGSWPTHPELLDYLADAFMDSGWDVKHMVKMIVLSNTYQQSSHADRTVVEVDPYNKLLARQGRFRIEAEFVRDNALTISGLLVDKVGGPSVKPYQPEGYWEFLNFPKRTWVHDKGPAEYRRGLYTHWQRTFLHPSLVNFDAPSREECVAQRTISNTPQQALTLLNDPTYVEAARVFAENIIKECPGDTNARLKWAYRRALSREPQPQEVAVLTELLDKHANEYGKDQKSAKELVSVGDAEVPADLNVKEWAAWTSVARTILNLHETITRY